MSYRFEYSSTFKRQITKTDGSWVNITFNRDERYNPFTERDIELIHRAFDNCYHRNQGFVNLLSRVGYSMQVLKNFHLSEGDVMPHINFRFHNFFEGGIKDERVYHAYFDGNGEIASITFLTNIMAFTNN